MYIRDKAMLFKVRVGGYLWDTWPISLTATWEIPLERFDAQTEQVPTRRQLDKIVSQV